MRQPPCAEHDVDVSAAFSDDRLEADPRLADAERRPVGLHVDERVGRPLDLDHPPDPAEALRPRLVGVLEADRHEDGRPVRRARRRQAPRTRT